MDMKSSISSETNAGGAFFLALKSLPGFQNRLKFQIRSILAYKKSSSIGGKIKNPQFSVPLPEEK